MADQSHLESALFYAQYVGKRAAKIANSIDMFSDGRAPDSALTTTADVVEDENGDEIFYNEVREDEVNRVAKYVSQIDGAMPATRRAIDRCNTALISANCQIAGLSNSKPGIEIDKTSYQHAHSALAGAASLITAGVRVYDDSTTVSTPLHRVPLDVDRLRSNFSDACRELSAATWMLTPVDFDRLLAAAERESAMATQHHQSSERTEAEERNYTVAILAKDLKVTAKTLNKYAKRADVATPGRGKKNHKYTPGEVCKICQAMLQETTDQVVKDAAERVLATFKTEK